MKTDDVVAIVQLMNRYAYGLDEHRFDILEECFAPDAVFKIEIVGGERIGPFEGRAAIMQLFHDSAASQNDRRRHVITNTFVDEQSESEDPPAVDVNCNLTLHAIANGKLDTLTTGIYRDRVTRADGRWRLLTRDLLLDLPY